MRLKSNWVINTVWNFYSAGGEKGAICFYQGPEFGTTLRRWNHGEEGLAKGIWSHQSETAAARKMLHKVENDGERHLPSLHALASWWCYCPLDSIIWKPEDRGSSETKLCELEDSCEARGWTWDSADKWPVWIWEELLLIIWRHERVFKINFQDFAKEHMLIS